MVCLTIVDRINHKWLNLQGANEGLHITLTGFKEYVNQTIYLMANESFHNFFIFLKKMGNLYNLPIIQDFLNFIYIFTFKF